MRLNNIVCTCMYIDVSETCSGNIKTKSPSQNKMLDSFEMSCIGALNYFHNIRAILQVVLCKDKTKKT